MFLKVQQKGGAHVSISPIFLLTIAHIIRSVSMCGLYVFVLLSYFINTSGQSGFSGTSSSCWVGGAVPTLPLPAGGAVAF